MSDEEILYGIPKITPVNINQYISDYFNTYITGLTDAQVIALFARLIPLFIPFQSISGELANVTRFFSISYHNSSALPMFISVSAINSDIALYKNLVLGVGGFQLAANDAPPSRSVLITAIIPPDSDYIVEPEDVALTLQSWKEIV